MIRPRIDKLFADRPSMLRAINKAGRQAMLMHKRMGNPIAGVRDDKVVTIPPEEIEVPPPIEQTNSDSNAA